MKTKCKIIKVNRLTKFHLHNVNMLIFHTIYYIKYYNI